ncbi:hypothetical protein BDV93DRAFT_460569 [Ceratobasidium sp. AG-I]|nr:hypothetical protein BDV93DRAFT_460569 [Ceratobasidium sp. AG-I]
MLLIYSAEITKANIHLSFKSPNLRRVRNSLFAEPYPDPSAGAPLRWENGDEEPPPRSKEIFEDPDLFEVAHWLANLPISDEERGKFLGFSRVSTKDLPWKNVKEFNRDIDALPHGPSWERRTIRVQGDAGVEVLDLWLRNIVDVVRQLISDRRFVQYMCYAPQKLWTSAERLSRVYNEMSTGDWWWRMQGLLGKGATMCPIIISSDKTQMSVLSGSKRAWPVYLSIGNISKDMRRRPSQHAMILIGYIPITDMACVSGETARREKSWEVFHACMSAILELLKEMSARGIEMLCADGAIRRVHPILASYIGDFPEQCLVTCVRQNRCPVCLVPSDQMGNYSVRYEERTRKRTLDAIEDNRQGYSAPIKALGIRPTWPFWASLPFVDISLCVTPDLLHQLNKGVFRYHLVKWCTHILGEREVDRRFRGMPRHLGTRHFTDGLSVIKQWTGNEAKQVAKVFLPVMAGCVETDAVKATRHILDFMYRAHRPELSDEDLEDLEGDLAGFHAVKDICRQTKALDTQEMFDGIPKLHMISHYARSIRELGTTDGYNTEATERLHIDFVKEGWRASNKVNPTEQMARYLQHKESWAILRAHLREIGWLPANFQYGDDPIPNSAGNESEVGDEGEVDDDGEVDGPIWYPSPAITIAKRPSLGRKTAAFLAEQHGAVDLIPATLRFLSRLCPNVSLPLFDNNKFEVWTRCRLSYARLPFLPSVEPHKAQVRAVPGSWDNEGRMKRFGSFDVVLFASHSAAGVEGLHQFEAGRIKTIFKVPRHLSEVCDQKLAYVELFRPFSQLTRGPTGLYTTRHATIDNKRQALVIPLSDIVMTCQLTPQYHMMEPDLRVTSSTDLLSEFDQFYLNKYSSHFMFAVLEHWRKRLEPQ